MTRYLLALTLLLALVAAPVLAEATLIRAGQEIGDVSQLMERAGYEETQLAMASKEEDIHLKMWSVGEGVLICSFSTKDKVVKDLSYYLCDARPITERTEFEFRVTRFAPDTGQMTIEIPKKPTSRGK
ncbi:hypothetical protein ACFL59_11345, partial [Planctomycetota bacterium]